MLEGDRMDDDDTRPVQPFKVTDRRKFTSEGELRGDREEETEETPTAPQAPSASKPPPASSGPAFERRSLQEPEEVDLTMLISAMAQQALRFLGEIPHPATGQPTLEPEQARLQIDMIELLRVKCRGNLTVQEESLLEQALYQLRMLYVARTQQRA